MATQIKRIIGLVPFQKSLIDNMSRNDISTKYYHYTIETIKLCNRYRVPMLPGVMTPTEAVTALEAGCDIIKIFPGNIVGPAAISSFKGPLPQGEFMPSGGVDVDNVDKWINAGAYAVGTGSSLTKGAKTGDFEAVTKKAQEFVAAVAAARK